MVFYIKVIIMKIKKLLTVIITMAILLVPLTSFASQEVLPADFAGNTTELIDIKSPELAVTTTANKACVISAVAPCNTTVTLYKLDPATNTYVKMYAADGTALESVVGAAGLYAQNFELTYGTNNLMAVATSKNLTETSKIQITLVKNNLICK